MSEDENGNALRVGGTIDASQDRFRVTLDAANLPVASFSGFDHRWLRPDINPKPQNATGDGYELEGILSYAFSQNLSLGICGRYLGLHPYGHHHAALLPARAAEGPFGALRRLRPGGLPAPGVSIRRGAIARRASSGSALV